MADRDMLELFTKVRLNTEVEMKKDKAQLAAELVVAKARVEELEKERDALNRRLSLLAHEVVETQRAPMVLQ